MTLNKKILAAAIVGGLVASTANAAVDLSADSPSPVRIASEVNFAANGTLPTTADAAAFTIETITGYAFSPQEVRYARLECSPNVRITADTGDLDSASGNISFGNVNGSGTNIIRFSLTASADVAEDEVISVLGSRTFTSRDASSCTFSLYDLPSQAQAGGAAGRIAEFSSAYAVFANTYGFQNTTNTTISSVEASPSFSRFVTDDNPTNNDGIAQIGEITFNRLDLLPTPAASAPTVLASGVTAQIDDILAANTRHVVSGDFSAGAATDGTFSIVLASTPVFVSTNANCSTRDLAPTALNATTATFNAGSSSVTARYVCFQPRAGALIPAAEYGIRLSPASETGFTASPAGPSALGSIVRDGTSLQAQFAQVPAGWTSRIVLTNTGSLPRPYTITAQTEAGVTSVLGTAATGTVPANGTIVLNTADIATFTGQPRGTLNVSVAGPNSQIQGLYQIVNGATGSIANTALVRPGTN